MVGVGSWKVGTVTATSTQTASARAITFDVPGWPGNLAGEHVDVRLTAPDGYAAVRSYSIASAGSDSSLELAVDRLPDGEVSPYLVDVLEVGDQVELRGPLGGWFVWKPEQTEPVQLIGGGSGIVPLMAMMRAHETSGSAARFRLLYSVRSPDDLIYAEEIARLASPTLEVTIVYTRSGPPGATIGRVGRVTLESVAFTASDNPLVFVCGPTGFVEAIATWLIELGHDTARVKTERFGGT